MAMAPDGMAFREASETISSYWSLTWPEKTEGWAVDDRVEKVAKIAISKYRLNSLLFTMS
jgi:hypothetical protein